MNQHAIFTGVRPMEKRFYNVPEIAQYLGVSVNTIRSWVWLRKIPWFKIRGLVRFDLREIDQWMNGQKIEVKQ